MHLLAQIDVNHCMRVQLERYCGPVSLAGVMHAAVADRMCCIPDALGLFHVKDMMHKQFCFGLHVLCVFCCLLMTSETFGPQKNKWLAST